MYCLLDVMEVDECLCLVQCSVEWEWMGWLMCLLGVVVVVVLLVQLVVIYLMLWCQFEEVICSCCLLEDSEEWLFIMLCFIGEVVMVIDIDGYVSCINFVVECLIGWLVVEVLGWFVQEVVCFIGGVNVVFFVCLVGEVFWIGEIQVCEGELLLQVCDGVCCFVVLSVMFKCDLRG